MYTSNKFAIGSFKPSKQNYTNHIINLEKNDVLYLFSDGSQTSMSYVFLDAAVKCEEVRMLIVL